MPVRAMRTVTETPNWPDSWRLSHGFDQLEVYGAKPRSGYSYMYRARREAAIGDVQRFVPRGSRILDVAAAQGNFTLELAELGYDVTWNDLRAELADYVKAKHEHGVVRYLPGNVIDLAVDEPFDAVLLTEVIEHVAHPDRFFRTIANLLRPNGWIILTTPNGGYFRNRLPRFSDCTKPAQFESLQFRPDADGHIFLLWDDEIIRLSGLAGLQVRELRHFCNPLTGGHLKLAMALNIMPRAWVDALENSTRRLPLPLARRIHSGTIAVLQRAHL
jgi:2-polyprenyl-3-methyl-5-hydroxy-6-metoxy-1,4-benzoquinol methylase